MNSSLSRNAYVEFTLLISYNWFAECNWVNSGFHITAYIKVGSLQEIIQISQSYSEAICICTSVWKNRYKLIKNTPITKFWCKHCEFPTHIHQSYISLQNIKKQIQNSVIWQKLLETHVKMNLFSSILVILCAILFATTKADSGESNR